jgi:hypothetical protein
MTNLIPYFACFITLLFGVGFVAAVFENKPKVKV